MGLGKTVQVLSLLAQELPWARSSLIVCPASVVPVWKAEAARFFPGLTVNVLQTGQDWSLSTEPCLWVASYTQLRRHRHLLPGCDFAYAVLDEAQFIKNPDAKVTQVCQTIRSAHRIAVTGTPLENLELDLWTLFRFLMPGLLGNRKRLETRLSEDAADLRRRLRRQVAPFVLRRTKAEVASELPPKVESTLHCPLTPLQEREYRRLAREGVASFGEDISKSLHERSMPFFALLTRLRQVCCDPGLLPWLDAPPTQSGKIVTLLEKLEDLVEQGRRAVVFSQFASLLHRVEGAIQAQHPSLPVHLLTGSTSDRARPVSAFQNGKGPAVILVSLKAGGTGITLSAADYVFLLDPWWNPAVEAQAIDRVHRIGQDKTVFVYRLVTPGTVEERIEKLKHDKRELFDSTVGNLADVSDVTHYFTSLSALIGADLAE
jgi:SNF2 family DNA or RNA helicase